MGAPAAHITKLPCGTASAMSAQVGWWFSLGVAVRLAPVQEQRAVCELQMALKLILVEKHLEQ